MGMLKEKTVTKTFTYDELCDLKKKYEDDERVAQVIAGALVGVACAPLEMIGVILGIGFGAALTQFGDYMSSEDDILEDILYKARKKDSVTLRLKLVERSIKQGKKWVITSFTY